MRLILEQQLSIPSALEDAEVDIAVVTPVAEKQDLSIVCNILNWLHMHQLPTLFSPSVELGYHSLRCESGWLLPIGPTLFKEFLYTLGFDVSPNEFC